MSVLLPSPLSPLPPRLFRLPPPPVGLLPDNDTGVVVVLTSSTCIGRGVGLGLGLMTTMLLLLLPSVDIVACDNDEAEDVATSSDAEDLRLD